MSSVLASDQFKLLSGKFPFKPDSSSEALSFREVSFSPRLKMILPDLVSMITDHHFPRALRMKFVILMLNAKKWATTWEKEVHVRVFFTDSSLVFAESVTQTRSAFRRTSILPTLLSKSTSPTVMCRYGTVLLFYSFTMYPNSNHQLVFAAVLILWSYLTFYFSYMFLWEAAGPHVLCVFRATTLRISLGLNHGALVVL